MGFLGDYGDVNNDWILYSGDQVVVQVWNAQTSTGPATFTVTVGESGKSLGQGGPGNCKTCDPIDIAAGNVFEQVTDYSTTGQNPLIFTRYYNSLGNILPVTTLSSTLGTNWRSTYDRYLQIGSPTSVTAERFDGSQSVFALVNGSWVTDSDLDLTLTNSGATWTLTDGSDTVETYVAVSATQARLQRIQTRNGYTRSLVYNTNNQLASVTDTYNRTLIFAYSNGLLQNLTTPDGLVLTYSYSSISGQSLLSKVSYSTTPATSKTYVYENSGLPFALTGVIDENGSRYATWSYNSTKRAVANQLGSGADSVALAYNADGTRMLTNALGQQEVYKFATLQGVSKEVEVDRQATSTTAAAKQVFTYDSNGYTASQTDWNGNLTTYVNNVHGLPTVINEAVGTPQARTTTITYDANWVHLPAKIVTPGLTTTFTYDSNGNPLTKTLTDTTSNTVPYSTNGQTRTWRYTWANGLLMSVQGPRTDAKELTTFGYDGSGTLTTVTNALGQVTKIAQHTPGGLPQTVADPNGVVTNLTYDSRLRLASSAVTTAAGVLTTKYAYDAAGNLLTTTLPDGSALTKSYDSAHRLTNVTDLFKQSIAYTLDALGDRTKVNIADATGKVQRTHSGNFDALGRVLQDIGGAGQTTKLSYDGNGNALSVTDPLNHSTQQAFDALNRPTVTTDPVGNTTFISYDEHDRPVSVTDPNGGTTLYTYDGFGDLIQQVSPTTGTSVFRYDPAGNLSQRIDARGVTVNFTYDALNRPLTTAYPGNAAENVTYSYDQAGHGFGIGRLTSLTDAAGTLSRSYDERGDVISEKRVQGGVTLATAYTYDAAQRVVSVGYPSGWTTSYTRDVMGRVTAIATQAPGTSAKPAPVVSGINYQPFGPPNALTYGNGVTEARSFDLDYRETMRAATGKAPLQQLGYVYDPANNVSSITDSVTAANSQSFGYDALNRLTTASGGYGKLSYTYDANGNRITDTSTATFPSLDGLGTMSGITYNQAGRVSAVTTGTNQVAGYSYDAFGHRLGRSGAIAGLYQYDTAGHLLEETDGQGNPQANYIYLRDQPIASVAPNSAHTYFLHDDRLGTPQAATDSSQTIMWQANYQPFGATSTGVGLITQDLRLPGQEVDSATGWYHNAFREYVPAWGRYSQSDPIGLWGGVNTYRYADGNPNIETDQFGLSSFSEKWQEGYERSDPFAAAAGIWFALTGYSKDAVRLAQIDSAIARSGALGGIGASQLRAAGLGIYAANYAESVYIEQVIRLTAATFYAATNSLVDLGLTVPRQKESVVPAISLDEFIQIYGTQSCKK
jgi:RHS repeat-associated protein